MDVRIGIHPQQIAVRLKRIVHFDLRRVAALHEQGASLCSSQSKMRPIFSHRNARAGRVWVLAVVGFPRVVTPSTTDPSGVVHA